MTWTKNDATCFTEYGSLLHKKKKKNIKREQLKTANKTVV